MSEVVTTISQLQENAFTITINDGVEVKQTTLDEYIDAFLAPTRSLYSLVNRDGDFDEVKAMQEQVKQLATRNFYRLHRLEARGLRYPNKQN